jgi:hypothetical protein
MGEAPGKAAGTAVALQAMASEQQSTKIWENFTAAKNTDYRHDRYGRKMVVWF